MGGCVSMCVCVCVCVGVLNAWYVCEWIRSVLKGGAAGQAVRCHRGPGS